MLHSASRGRHDRRGRLVALHGLSDAPIGLVVSLLLLLLVSVFIVVGILGCWMFRDLHRCGCRWCSVDRWSDAAIDVVVAAANAANAASAAASAAALLLLLLLLLPPLLLLMRVLLAAQSSS